MPEKTVPKVPTDLRRQEILQKDLIRYGKKTSENCVALQERLKSLVDGSRVFANPDALIDAVDQYFRDTRANLKKNDATRMRGSLDGERMRRFKAGEFKHFNDEAFSLLVEYLLVTGLYHPNNRGAEISDKFPDPLFHAMLNFMDVGDITLGKLRYRAPGLYRAFRPSSTFPGHYWEGLLDIVHDEKSGVVHVTETYASASIDDRPEFFIQFKGYLFRKSQQHFIVARDTEQSSISVTLINTFSLSRGLLLTLRGSVMDMSRGRPYSSRVFYERHACAPDQVEASRKELLGKLRVLPADHMPRSIRNFFDELPIANVKLYS